MYSIRDFVVYDGRLLNAKTPVLVWSLKTGYFFTSYSEVAAGQVIAGMSI